MWEDGRGRQRGAAKISRVLSPSEVRKLSIPVVYGSFCWEKQLGLLTAQMRTNRKLNW